MALAHGGCTQPQNKTKRSSLHCGHFAVCTKQRVRKSFFYHLKTSFVAVTNGVLHIEKLFFVELNTSLGI